MQTFALEIKFSKSNSNRFYLPGIGTFFLLDLRVFLHFVFSTSQHLK